jgi:hypothetical protein
MVVAEGLAAVGRMIAAYRRSARQLRERFIDLLRRDGAVLFAWFSEDTGLPRGRAEAPPGGALGRQQRHHIDEDAAQARLVISGGGVQE